MNLHLPTCAGKPEIFQAVRSFLESCGFRVSDEDQTRPWGGFYVIDESQSRKFIDFFLGDVPQASEQAFGKISPKILIVEAGKRLSWQFHHRRSEVWKVIAGEAGVITSQTDEENGLQLKKTNDVIILKQGERHRLIGTDTWGVIAEIWQHTDENHPSNEEDIVRVQDDFGR